MTPVSRSRPKEKNAGKSRWQKQLERRATAPERRRATIAARYGLYGDETMPGYPRPGPKPKPKHRRRS